MRGRVDASATEPHHVFMTDIAHAEVPAITLGWRLRISLERAGIRAEEMAGMLDVHRGTISRWMHDEAPVRTIYLREWARICRVPFEWLAGDAAVDNGLGTSRNNGRYMTPLAA